MNNLFFELLQVAIGRRDLLSKVPTADEWSAIYGMSVKQALVGVCFCGMQRLPKEMMPPKDFLLKWFAMAESVRKRNLLMNAQAKEVAEKFARGEFRSCVLKGQGLAEMYNPNLGLYRQSGDIDLWVDAERKSVLNYARSFGEITSVDFKHADLRYFEDVEVEIHSTPTWFYNPIHYQRFLRWLDIVKENQFNIGEMGFASPTIEFNLLFVLIHIYKHLFDEGVGLRQLMDYYFVLLHSSETERISAYKTLCTFGMRRFAGATMFVIKEVFSMEDRFLLCAPSEEYGRKFLNSVVDGGNFGRYDKRNHHGKENTLQRGIRNIRHNMQIFFDYPSEVLWAPFWKVWHLVWRKINGYY